MMISERQLLETVLRSLPERIEIIMRFETIRYDLQSIWKHAAMLEEILHHPSNREILSLVDIRMFYLLV